MADDTTASLGIEVHTKGAKESVHDLNDVKTAAKGTADAAKDLAGVQQKTSDSMKSAAQGMGAAGQATSLFGRALSDVKGVFSGIGVSIAGLFTGFGNYSGAANSATTATHGVRAAIHTLDPILASAGVGMGNLGSFAFAARAGIVGLGIAIVGGFLAAIASAGDKIEVMQKNLKALSGNGAQNFKDISAAARETGVDVNTLADIVQSLDRGLRNTQTSKWVGDLRGIGIASGQIAKVVADLIKATGADQGAVKAFFASIADAGKLTLEAFDALEKVSPSFAEMISKAFNKGSVKELRDELELTPPSIELVRNKLAAYAGSAADAAAHSKAFGDELGKLLATWRDTEEALSKAGFGQVIIGALQAVNGLLQQSSGGFKTWADADINDITRVAEAIKGGLTPAATELMRLLDEGPKANFDAYTQSGQNSFNALEMAARSALSAVGDVILQIVQSVVGGVMSMVQSALAALASLAQANASAGVIPGAEGMPVMGGPSFDINSNDFTAGFATGGSFVVGGDGGTDSTRVQFMATKGELVTITPAGLTSPNGLTGASAASFSPIDSVGGAATSSAGVPVKAITGPITQAIMQSAQMITGSIEGGAVGGSGVPWTAVGAGQRGVRLGALATGFRIARGHDSPGWGNNGGYNPYDRTYDYQQFGSSGPSNDYYSQYAYQNPIAQTSVYSPGGGQDDGYIEGYGTVYAATGGSFTVPSMNGRTGPDSQLMKMHLTPGERVSISPDDGSRRRIGGQSGKHNITINVYGAQSPASFIAAEAQIRRGMGRIFR